MLTQEDALSLFEYNPDSGYLIWKTNIGRGRKRKRAGTKHIEGYRSITVRGFRLLEHRLIWLFVYGNFPEGDIDHINGIRDDNRLINLRNVSRNHNNLNRSGDIGVCFYSRDSIWVAYIGVNYMKIHLGRFKTKEEAVLARKNAEEFYYPSVKIR